MQQKINLTRMICLRIGKTTVAKPHWVNLRLPLPRIHYYQNKRLHVKESQYLIPTYSWTLTPIPNWTCFIVTISHFQCTAPSTWLTNCVNPIRDLITNLRKMLATKFFSSSHDEDQEASWSQNPTMYKHNNFFKRKMN